MSQIANFKNDKVLLVNIGKSFGKRENLYEETRKWWKTSLEKAESVNYVVAVVRNEIKGVFVPEKWLPSDNEKYPDRIMFEGYEVTNKKEILERYNGLEVPFELRWMPGMANPCRYNF